MRAGLEKVAWSRSKSAVGDPRAPHASYILLTCSCTRYHNVRIDSVHYCEREYELSEKRRRKSFFERNGEPKDASKERLLLFMRTVRDHRDLAMIVHSLRVPYMTREAYKAELARTVSVLPNLRYIDLPEGFYSDDHNCLALKQELQVCCPDIRRMKYSCGSKKSFMDLPRTCQWQSLEVLELSGLDIEPQTLLHALSNMRLLRDLKCVDLAMLDDDVFQPSSSLPSFPPVERLTLHTISNVHAGGLATYLSRPQNRRALMHLTLTNTGVQPQHLYLITARAPYLKSLSVCEEVAFPQDPSTPLLSSASLKHLHFEITSMHPSRGLQPANASYYAYLSTSLLGDALPALRDLYVRDSNFPHNLVLTTPPQAFSAHAKSAVGLRQPLCVYTRGLDELEWNFFPISPSAGLGKRGSVAISRPISLLRAGPLSPSWGGQARKSVVVGNGFGGFLAVPADEMTRSGSFDTGAAKSRRDSKVDLWR